MEENLCHAFPEKTTEERFIIEKKYYHFLADMIFESIKMFTISESELNNRFKYKNLHELSRLLDTGRSVIAVTGHYANWEWGSLSIGTQLKQPVLVVYKPLSDNRFGDKLNKVRARFGASMIAMKQTLRAVIEHKNIPHVLVLLGDQTPVRRETQYFVPFLNKPTAVFLGIEKIAKMTNHPVIYFTISRIKRGYYEVEITVLAEQPQELKEHELTEAHTRKLEQDINKRPELWLWSHRRWKFKPEDILL